MCVFPFFESTTGFGQTVVHSSVQIIKTVSDFQWHHVVQIKWGLNVIQSCVHLDPKKLRLAQKKPHHPTDWRFSTRSCKELLLHFCFVEEFKKQVICIIQTTSRLASVSTSLTEITMCLSGSFLIIVMNGQIGHSMQQTT